MASSSDYVGSRDHATQSSHNEERNALGDRNLDPHTVQVDESEMF